MLAFLLTIYLAFAYNPYVRSLRRPHQWGGTQQGGNPMMFGEYDMGDIMEAYAEWAPMMSGVMAGMSSGQASQSAQSNPFQPFSAFMQPYMNNPYQMNMQKCMDNDACTAWVTHRMYQGFGGSSSGAATGGAATGGSSDNTASTGSGENSGAATGGSGSGESSDSQTVSGSGSTGSGSTSSYSPAMVGFPAGFNPAFYGLDWDSVPKDCMDDSKCARGLMMFTHGRNMGGSLANLFTNFYMGSRLQRPRRLSRPRYGVPYRYGRQY